MERTKRISEAELEVMKILWQTGRPMSGLEIVNALKPTINWEDSTIYTLIRRLTKKGALNQKKDGIFYYTPNITEETYIEEQTKGLVDKLFSGNAKSLVSMLLKNQSLDEADIMELKAYWDKENRSDG